MGLQRPRVAQVTVFIRLGSALVTDKFRMSRMLIDLFDPSFMLQLAHMRFMFLGLWATGAAFLFTHGTLLCWVFKTTTSIADFFYGAVQADRN
jgi:hypothetical protein